MKGVPEINDFAKKGSLVFGVILIAIIIVGVLWGPSLISMYYFREGEKAFMNGDYLSANYNLGMASRIGRQTIQTEALLARSLVASVYQKGKKPAQNAKDLYQESLSHFEIATSLGINETYPEYDNFLNDQGFAYWGVEDYEKADAIFLQVIKKYPESSFSGRILVARDYLERTGRPREALDILKPSFELPNPNPGLLLQGYILALRLSNYFNGYADMQKYAQLVIDAAPSDDIKSLGYAYTNLAIVASAKGDVKTAKEWIDSADKLYKQPGRFACILANIYYKNNQEGLAFASAKSDNHPICWAVLGKIYLERGDKQNARLYGQKTLDALNALPKKDIFTIQGIKSMEDFLKNI